MMGYLSVDELLRLGFSRVAEGTKVSRRAIFYDISGELGANARIDDFAILTGNVLVGENVHVSPFCFLGGTGGTIRLEKGAGMSTHVSLFTKSDDYQTPAQGKRQKVSGDILVGEYSILGAQCVVLPGAKIGKYCSIGVGCVISGQLPDSCRYVSMGVKSVRIE